MYWTKFECISGKIRRILTTNCTRGARSSSKPLRTLRLSSKAIQFSLRGRYTFRTDVLKVLRKCPTLSHLGHARRLACAKTKKFPRIFSRLLPRHGYFPAGKFRDPTSRCCAPALRKRLTLSHPPPRSVKDNGKEIFGFASP